MNYKLKHWSLEEDSAIFSHMNEYRNLIYEKSTQEATKIRQNFVEDLCNEYQFLKNRTINSIKSHLCYLDKVTSGNISKKRCINKYIAYYGKIQRNEKLK